jgi:hypothetical protein
LAGQTGTGSDRGGTKGDRQGQTRTVRKKQGQPETGRASQRLTGAARDRQGQPETSRDSQRQAGADRNRHGTTGTATLLQMIHAPPDL